MENKRFKPNLFFLVAILAVVGLAYYARQKNNNAVTFQIEPAELESKSAESSDANDDAETRGIDNVNEPPPAEIADKDIEPLKKWVSEEAQSLNHSNIDLESRDRFIVERIKSFGKQQLSHLQKISQDPTAPINERILSTYMLGKSDQANQNLKDIASSDVVTKDFDAHSASEIAHNQEVSVKIMAIDGIFKSGESVEARVAALQEIINQSNVPVVKQYAQKKVNELVR